MKDTSASFPRRLSRTGLFSSLEKLKPAPGVVPYAVRVERWMDGAKAERWVAIPSDGRIQLATGKDASTVYPEGTVLVKQLSLARGESGEPIRLETQLLHYERGLWHPYSYLWDDAGRDAVLVASIGASRPLRVANATASDHALERTWQINAANECKLCHNAGPRFVLGFTLNQLDLAPADANPPQSSEASQLNRLAAQGVLAPVHSIPTPLPTPFSTAGPSRLVDPRDPSQPLDDRARSYLHANCSNVPSSGGQCDCFVLLARDLPFDKLNTNKGTGIGTFGMRDAMIIVPGDPYSSLLLYRMSKLGYARMPYIGSRVVDSAGVALIEEWIRSLPRSPASSVSASASEDSAQAKSLRLLANKESDQGKQADEAIRDLLESTEGSLVLVAEMHRGSLSERSFQAAVAAGSAAKSDIRGLFETFVPESKRRATLGPNIDPQAILSRQGDHQRGKLIYFSDGARCRACHEIDDRSKSLGPTLQEIGKKYPRPAEMLQHVLQPSLKIDDPYAAYMVVADDGRVLSGLIVDKTDQEITIKTTEKQVMKIARQNVAEMRKAEKSLMPDRILSDLTAQEAADLLEYLRSPGR